MTQRRCLAKEQLKSRNGRINYVVNSIASQHLQAESRKKHKPCQYLENNSKRISVNNNFEIALSQLNLKSSPIKILILDPDHGDDRIPSRDSR